MNNNIEKQIMKTEEIKQLERVASNLFAEWNQLLQGKEAVKVAEKYSPEGELFGTVSNKIRHGQQEIAEYFKHFLESNPVGTIKEMKVIPIDDKTFLMGGTYVFEVDDGQGGRKEVEANFTYVWRKDDNQNWKIIHHHSAVKKEGEITIDKNLLLKDTKDIQEGITKKFNNGFVLKTYFFKDESDNKEKRVTKLYQVTGGESNEKNVQKNMEIIYQQISEKPDGSAGV